MAGSVHERILAAEMVAVMGIETADALYSSTGGSFALPSPSQYFATMVVYAMLAGVAMFGEKPGRLAGAFGGVAALAILLAPRKGGKPPFIIGALDYFNSLMTGGTLGQQNDFNTAASGGGPSGDTAVNPTGGAKASPWAPANQQQPTTVTPGLGPTAPTTWGNPSQPNPIPSNNA
jgi:hypothetical protein